MSALDLTTLHLDNGSHKDFGTGHCLMEAVAYFAGEPHSDRPQCVSPYLRSFGITLNDRVTDEQRQDLVRFVPLVIGTAGDGLDEQRRWLAADHVARTTVPMWLDLAGLTDHAATLRGCAPITDRSSWQATRSVIRAARDAAWALRSERRTKIRADVTAAVKKALAERPVAAVTDAAADVAAVVAVAADADVAAVVAADAAADVAADAVTAAAAAVDADAAADAAADAVTAADVAVAAAVAVAVVVAADAAVAADVAVDVAADAAVAAAAAVDVAAAVAADVDADAAADAAADRYWVIRRAVYDAVYAKMRAVYGERFAPVAAAAWPDALALYGRLINPVAA